MAAYFSTEAKSLVGESLEVMERLPHQELVQGFLDALRNIQDGEQHLDTLKDENQRSYQLNILHTKGFRDLTLKDISD